MATDVHGRQALGGDQPVDVVDGAAQPLGRLPHRHQRRRRHAARLAQRARRHSSRVAVGRASACSSVQPRRAIRAYTVRRRSPAARQRDATVAR